MTTGRKIIFVLGAGASLGAGAYARVQHGGTIRIPTQETFWSTYLRFCRSRDNRKKIQAFLFKYFTDYKKVPSRLTEKSRNQLLASIDVEEVFTFISERIQAPATSSQMKASLNEIWSAMTTEIGNVFSRFEPNMTTRRLYKCFASRHILAHDGVISFNYDTVFERSLGTSRPWGYPCVTPTTSKLSIYKPHGSINWELAEDGNIKVVRQSAGSPVIVAPSHLKFVGSLDGTNKAGSAPGYLNNARQLADIWSEMEAELKLAKALVFIGYSFPSADLYFTSLLRTVLNSRAATPAIALVNPDAAAIGARLRAKFGINSRHYFDLEQFNNSPRRHIVE